MKNEIKIMEKRRKNKRNARKSVPLPIVSLVGYTNAGKSTLLNKLTKSTIRAKDELFSTLDPTTRQYILPSNQKILLSDTVGFIQRLPHNLVLAFRSTLEEAVYADILVHMIDCSDINWREKIKVVEDILGTLGCKDQTIIKVFNKSDLAPERSGKNDFVNISAKKGTGIPELVHKIDDELKKFRNLYTLKVPRYDNETLKLIYSHGKIINKEELPTEVYFEISLDKRYEGKIKNYLILKNNLAPL